MPPQDPTATPPAAPNPEDNGTAINVNTPAPSVDPMSSVPPVDSGFGAMPTAPAAPSFGADPVPPTIPDVPADTFAAAPSTPAPASPDPFAAPAAPDSPAVPPAPAPSFGSEPASVTPTVAPIPTPEAMPTGGAKSGKKGLMIAMVIGAAIILVMLVAVLLLGQGSSSDGATDTTIDTSIPE